MLYRIRVTIRLTTPRGIDLGHLVQPGGAYDCEPDAHYLLLPLAQAEDLANWLNDAEGRAPGDKTGIFYSATPEHDNGHLLSRPRVNIGALFAVATTPPAVMDMAA